MIDIERRLQHAARELREVRIDPPPLPTERSERHSLTGRLPTLVMPVLFVLGGLAIVAGGMGRTVEEVPPALPAAATAVAPETAAAVPRSTAPPLTVHQEVALIATLGSARVATPEPALEGAAGATAPAAPTPDLRSFSQHYR